MMRLKIENENDNDHEKKRLLCIMLERSPYPLLTLKLLGSICPCLEKEDDGTARRAAWSLSSVHVRWHKGANNLSENNASSMMSGFVKGIFGGSSSTDGGSGGSSDKSYESIDGCTLTIEDAKGGPQLIMSPPPSRAIGKKRVPLRMIKTVRLAAPSRSSKSSGIEVILDNNDVVLRFDVLKPLQFSEEDIDEENNIQVEDADDATRDDTLVQLQILVEWERRRQAHLITLGVDEPAEDIDQINDNDGQSLSSSPKRGGGMIADKARKVQHFAQREIEMQKQKRNRESRKAKYVKEAGGLKYTAIAMANRS